MSAADMPKLPGWVLVRAYTECGRFIDDSPGTRADCSAKFRAGKPCERCPSNTNGDEVLHTYARTHAAAVAAPLVEALEAARLWIESQSCEHESTHRGGAIWTICDQCGKKWADDEGGFQPYQAPPIVDKISAALAAFKEKP